MKTTIETREQLLEAILNADRQSANQLLDDWATQFGVEKTINEILDPTLEDIGKIWESSTDLSLAQAYVSGKISEDFMLKHVSLQGNHTLYTEDRGSIILGNIEDDFHSLGRKMVGIFLRAAGWKVIDLGNDVLATEFVDKAVELKARVIGISAMMYSTAVNIKKVRDEIDKRKLTNQIKLAVGGAVFRLRPELVAEVGGDGTTGNAMNANLLFEKLWSESSII
jgi:methanogenic corrinoid protein MtbC1